MKKKIVAVLLSCIATFALFSGCNKGKGDDGASTSSQSQSLPEASHTVTLDKTEMTLAIGETEILTATVSPISASSKPRQWRSSNGAVASVNGVGEVTAKSVGSAVITVTVDGVSATCTVTVVAADE